MSPSRLFVLAGLAMVLGCSAPGDWAPPHGGPEALTAATDHDGDPAVVAIVRAADPGSLVCTGTVIGERVVLTAAHCGAQDAPGALEVFFGAELLGEGRRLGILDAIAHPAHDETADADLALVLLAEPAPAAPAPLGSEPLAAPPAPARLVGFGVTTAGGADDDRKREGHARIVELTPESVALGADPSLPCNGDSGGPVFVSTASGERLAAVISRGDAACSDLARATRVDAHLDGFVRPQLDAWAAGSVPLAARCLYDEHCESALCVEALDDPRLRFCSEPCAAEADCTAPLTCSADRFCRHATPSPGAIGAGCDAHADCLDGVCLETERVCSVRCVSGRDGCPSGFACTHLGGVDFFCLAEPPPAGGCRAGTPSDAGATLVLATIALAAIAVRRRARRRTRERGARIASAPSIGDPSLPDSAQ